MTHERRQEIMDGIAAYLFHREGNGDWSTATEQEREPWRYRAVWAWKAVSPHFIAEAGRLSAPVQGHLRRFSKEVSF